jgi:peptidoglycan/LPS O-acetylase OafA/YrhL
MNTTIATNDDHTQISRVYGLDMFRAFAILFVLIGHCFQHSKIPPEISTFGRLGILGVELFFVLSGFLIGSIIMLLIEEKRFHSFADISSFWKRRWLRTLPLYFVALLAFIRLDYQGRHNLFEYPTYFVFMQNFAYKIPEFFELSWSLAIEEHFYLWFPVAFLIWERITKRAHLAIILTALTFITIAYAFRLSHPIFSDWNEYNRTIRLTVLSRMDAIMFGVLMAATKHYWNVGFNWVNRATPFTAAMLVLLCTWWFGESPHLMQSRELQINLFTVQSILCALLLPWFDGMRSTGGRGGFFVITSKLSYSLYLVHILVIVAVNKALQYLGLFDQIYSNPFVLYPLYFSFFYLVSWVTYHQIEKPFLRLRDVPLTWQSVTKASGVSILACAVLIGFF